jgi:hypothetical protein
MTSEYAEKEWPALCAKNGYALNARSLEKFFETHRVKPTKEAKPKSKFNIPKKWLEFIEDFREEFDQYHEAIDENSIEEYFEHLRDAAKEEGKKLTEDYVGDALSDCKVMARKTVRQWEKERELRPVFLHEAEKFKEFQQADYLSVFRFVKENLDESSREAILAKGLRIDDAINCIPHIAIKEGFLKVFRTDNGRDAKLYGCNVEKEQAA